MFDKILVPTDGSALSDKAVVRAIEYCQRTGATMVALYVRAHTPIAHTVAFADYSEAPADSSAVYTPGDVRRGLEAQGQAILQHVVDRAQAAGVGCTSVLEANDQPYKAIIDVAAREAIGLIFMASHGRSGFEALLLGSETQKVLTHSKVPVLVFR